MTSKVGSGSTPRGGASTYIDEGTALIRSQNVYDHHFKTDGLVFIPEETAHSMRGVTVCEGDILINITGDSILRTTIVPNDVLPARVNQHVAIVRVDESMCPHFVQKWLSSDLMKKYMLNHSSGGTRKAITKGHLESFLIPTPDLKVQQRIAHILVALDGKIESNQRIIEIIDALTLAFYETFIEDVPGQHQRLEEHFGVIIGRTPPRKEKEWFGSPGQQLVDWASIKDMGSATTFLTKTAEALTPEAVSTFRVPGANFGDILISFKLTVGRVAIAASYMCTNEAIATVHIDDPIWREYTYLYLKTFNYASLGNTSSIATAVNSKTIKAMPFFAPTESFVRSFHDKVKPLFDLSLSMERQNEKLTRLRNSLLPELLSGRITPEQLEAGL